MLSHEAVCEHLLSGLEKSAYMLARLIIKQFY
jgi:hypothetical protein